MKLFKVYVETEKAVYDVYTSALIAANSMEEAEAFIKKATCAKDDFELPKDTPYSYSIREVLIESMINPTVLSSSFFSG
jgi:hypothetical protein